MTHPNEPRRGRIVRALISRKVRAVLCLGVFAAPVAVGTMAYWTDEATVTSGQFSSGRLDLTVGASVAESSNLPGTGGEFAYSTLTISNLVPGESIARPFVVRNSGTTGFTYNGTVTTVDNNLVDSAGGLRVQLYPNSTLTNAGSEEGGNRVGTCSGTAVYDQAVSMTSNTTVYPPAGQSLLPNATRTYCVKITLATGTPNALQGKITSIVVKLNAKQLGAP